MDLCVVDWKVFSPIIAALIASCTALYISNKWRSQKGSEVIASHAIETIFKMSELSRFFTRNMRSFDLNHIKNFNEEFDQLYKEITMKIDFLSQAPISMKDRKQFIQFGIEFIGLYILIRSKIESKELSLLEKNKLLKQTSDKYRDLRIPVVETLMNYSLFKDGVKFY